MTDVFTLEELKNIPYTVNQYLVTPEIIDKIAFPFSPIQRVLSLFPTFLLTTKPSSIERAVYLDNIADPGNMGTIIRVSCTRI